MKIADGCLLRVFVTVAHPPATPITATALALESRDGDQSLDTAIIVSCDIIAIRTGIQDKVREKVKARLAGFDRGKIFSFSAPRTRRRRRQLRAGIPQNRRAVRGNGTGANVWRPDRADFRGFEEGYEDHGVEILFSGMHGRISRRLRSVLPASYRRWKAPKVSNADHWHEVREMLRRQYGDGGRCWPY
ncbi:MAG: hypothetical protein N3B01_10140 [Verrucomicrobiae bacterium]|nr:hypothetical protein [Verrucomicrobiae bacterium]